MQILLHADLLVNSYLYQICGILGSSAFPGLQNELLHTQDHLCSLVTSSFLMGIHGLSHPEAKTVQHRKYDCRVWMSSVRKQRHSRWENTAPHKECVKGRTEFGLKQNAVPRAQVSMPLAVPSTSPAPGLMSLPRCSYFFSWHERIFQRHDCGPQPAVSPCVPTAVTELVCSARRLQSFHRSRDQA